MISKCQNYILKAFFKCILPTTNSLGIFSELPELLFLLPLVLWVKLIDWIEYFSHFCDISPHCHKLQNLQVLLSSAILNNMNSLKVCKSFFCVCFKKFHEKLWSFKIMGTFFLLNLSVSSISERKQYSKYTQCLLQKERMGILVKMSMSPHKNCSRCWRTRFIKSICRTVCCLQWEGVAAFQQCQKSRELQCLNPPPWGWVCSGRTPVLYQHPLVSTLPSCFVPIRVKDGQLVLDFGVLIFMRSNIHLCEKDKNHCVRIRSRPPWLGSLKIQNSFKFKLEYFIVIQKSSYCSKMDFTFGARIKMVFT